MAKASYFSIKKDIFQTDDLIGFDIYVKKQNKREVLVKSGHKISNEDLELLLEHKKVFIDSSGVDSYKKFYKAKNLTNKNPKQNKIRYFSINKKVFSVDDKLEFSLYLKDENKKVKYTEPGHLFTKEDKVFFLKQEKVFIKEDDVQNYKKYIRDKKASKKPQQETGVAKTEEINYKLVKQNYFNIDDMLDFELYIDIEDKKSQFTKFGRIITKDDKNVLTQAKKVYVKSEEFDNYTAFLKMKKLSIELVKKSEDLDFIMSEIKTVLSEIFQKKCHVKNIQLLYPLAKNLTSIIMNRKLKLDDLRGFISRDYTTSTHSLNVAIYAAVIAMELKLAFTDTNNLILSAILHDIGKINISKEILYKESKLTKYEYREIKKHPTIGVLLAKEYGIVDKDILSGIHHHNERLDGSGYPNGSKNHNISLFARIIGICDVFDAISTNRKFQDKKKAFDTLIEMKKTMNNQLDNELMGSFIKIVTS